jgi:ABC-type multidrug transport system ATPase subunit
LQAILGPSGAGKSTLLDLLACRKTTGQITGRLLVNGRPASRSQYSKRIAYVPQVACCCGCAGCGCAGVAVAVLGDRWQQW